MTTSTGNQPIRSQDLFGSIIDNVKGDARKLATVLVTAYADLVALNSTGGSELLTSYLYLTDVAVLALSNEVKGELQKAVPGYENGKALALVIELVATTAEELYQKAALPRNSDNKTLTGFENLNEAQIVRVYDALNQQTKGILVNNGIDTQGAWAMKLLGSAPTLDKLVQMDFGTMHGILTGLTGTPTAYQEATAYEKATVHKIYAGMTSGIPTNVQIPPVRKHILISGLSMFVADELEKMGKLDLSDVDQSAFSGLIDQSLKKLVAKKVAFERYSDRVITNDDAEAFRKKMQHAWQLSLKDASDKGGNKKPEELTEAEKLKIKDMMKEVEQERKDLLKEVSTLLDEVDTDSNVILEEQREKVKKLIIELQGKSTLELSPMQGMEQLSARLEALSITSSGPAGMLTLKAYETNEDLVSNVYGGAALKGIGIFVDDDETIVVPSRTLLKQPSFVQLGSPALPFRTVTERSTNESSMHSFIASSLSSSHGTAKKTKSSVSGSVDTTLFKGGLAVVNESGSSGGVSNNSGSVDEEIVKSTEACVSEFTFMPMKSFSRSEGSFELSDEAYGRLEKINDPQGALDFLKRFGSHIPMGNQTLGGVFIRTMRITSREETKISDLYDAASVQLSKTNATAATVNAQAGNKWFGSASINISHARSSSYTFMGQSAHNQQDSTVASNATFDSNVICHGPNAVDQDSFYEQLSKSNATWAVIDRGDSNTYFSIWELIEFMNLTSFEKQCKLLKAQWMRMALDNYSKYPRDQKLLIDLWQSSAASSAEVSAFVKALIDCLIPIKLAPFDNVLAGQFETVVKAASALQNAVPALTPTQFIEAGFAALTIDDTNQLFTLVEGTTEYDFASAQMLAMTKVDFMEFEKTYNKQKNTKLILAKAENQYLANLCRSYFESVEETNWDYFKELVFPSDSNGATSANKDAFNDRLNDQLMTPEATENKYLCLHYLMNNQEDDTLFKRILLLTPDVLVATDSASENLFDDVLQNGNDNIRKLWDELTLVNVARGKVATGNVHGSYPNLVASNAVNGSTEGTHGGSGSKMFHSSYEVDQKWSVDLVNRFDIEQIKIHNRSDKEWQHQMNNFKVHVLDDGIEQWSIDVDKIEDVWTHTLPRGKSGDEVKITRNNSNRNGAINIAEVEVYSRNLRNVAFGKKADQSSYYDAVAMPASNAVNGLTIGTHSARTIVHTADNKETTQYWEVDLDGSYSIESIHVYNRSDHPNLNQLKIFKVEVFDENDVQKYIGERQEGPKSSTVFLTPKDTVGNKVKISRNNSSNNGYVVLAEVQVFARP